jgi:hypothetical protein
MSGERKKPHRAELRYANANDTFNRNFHAALSAKRSRRGGGVNYATIAHCFPGVKNSQGSQNRFLLSPPAIHPPPPP